MSYFNDEANWQLIERLKQSGVQLEQEVNSNSSVSNKLEGLSFVISGKFYTISREELKELIEKNGGKNLSGVSEKCNYLIAGDNMGPAKLEKATKLGVKIISEQEFFSQFMED